MGGSQAHTCALVHMHSAPHTYTQAYNLLLTCQMWSFKKGVHCLGVKASCFSSSAESKVPRTQRVAWPKFSIIFHFKWLGAFICALLLKVLTVPTRFPRAPCLISMSFTYKSHATINQSNTYSTVTDNQDYGELNNEDKSITVTVKNTSWSLKLLNFDKQYFFAVMNNSCQLFDCPSSQVTCMTINNVKKEEKSVCVLYSTI